LGVFREGNYSCGDDNPCPYHRICGRFFLFEYGAGRQSQIRARRAAVLTLLAGTRRQRWSLAIIASAFVFCVTVAMKAQVLASQDLYLHISIGRWILANHSIPDHGIFSASMPDAPWVAHEWLASVGLGSCTIT